MDYPIGTNIAIARSYHCSTGSSKPLRTADRLGDAGSTSEHFGPRRQPRRVVSFPPRGVGRALPSGRATPPRFFCAFSRTPCHARRCRSHRVPVNSYQRNGLTPARARVNDNAGPWIQIVSKALSTRRNGADLGVVEVACKWAPGVTGERPRTAAGCAPVPRERDAIGTGHAAAPACKA